MKGNPARLMLTAPASGSGKTMVTCAALKLLAQSGKAVSFKCGPDYIDPMFHRKVLHTSSYQLDSFFMERDALRRSLLRHTPTGGIAVLEGAMGYYDGVAGTTTQASAYEVAKQTKTPVVLVIDCKQMSTSVLAVIHGFLTLYPDSGIKGVIFNQLSAARYPELQKLVEQNFPVKALGYLPFLPECQLESRHLGLVTAQEVTDLQNKLERLAEQARESLDFPAIVALAHETPELEAEEELLPERVKEPPVIALARDEAFCFTYQENLELLEQLGAEILPFSPLWDKEIPENADGLLLSGGYPELYAKTLSENDTMRDSVLNAVHGGTPCIAECGGFLYLGKSLVDQRGECYDMAGALPMESYPKQGLGRFGYITLTAQKDNLLCPAEGQIKAHEFHYWETSDPGSSFSAVKPVRGTKWECAHTSRSLYAGFPHLFLPSNPEAAKRFVLACCAYRQKRRNG